MKPLLRIVRDLRWRWLNWSAASDKAFHDQLFAAQAYDPFSTSYPGYVTIRRFADLAAPWVTPGGTVLDLGCGPGEITCELARRFPATAFSGVDHSETAIEQARANAQRLGLTNIAFLAGDVRTHLPTGRLDLVTMFDSFHHLLDPVSFIGDLGARTDRFFLIEPAGNALGQWRDSHDFDWLASDLDEIREKLDRVFGDRPPTAPGAAAAPMPTEEAAVERRYTHDDFARFFAGFTLTVTGTSSGLISYPPSPSLQTQWRGVFGEQVYAIYKALDERLLAENRDLWSRHWAIAAVRGGPAQKARTPVGGPIRPTMAAAGGAYGVDYQSYVGPTTVAPDRQFEGVVRVANTGSTIWSSDDEPPTNLSYRWLGADGTEVPTDQVRTRLPRPIAPGETLDLAIAVRSPATDGRYVLAVDLVREGVTWFSQRGVPPLRVKVRVASNKR